MDANQLADAIARAVELAKPATEYCFLWIDWWPTCMTKAEWSGWMQAIFSVLAIAAAVAIAGWQRREEREHGRAVHLAQAQVVAGRATIAILNLYAVVDGLLARWNKHHELHGIEPTVMDICHYSQRLSFPEPADLLAMAHAWPKQIATVSKAIGHVELAIDTLHKLKERIEYGGSVDRSDATPPIVLLTGARSSLLAAAEQLPGGETPASESVASDQNGMSSSMSSNPDEARGGGAGDRPGSGA